MGIVALLYFMLPAYIANIVPPLIRTWKFLDTPMDFGKKLHGKPILGIHKTWRGMVIGTLIGTLAFLIQQTFTPPTSAFALFDYSSQSVYLGFLLSFGALLGDAAKSCIKRQMGIPPGKPWFIADQLDYIIGALAFGSIYYLPTTFEILMIMLISIILTILVKHIGYYIGVNKVAW